MSYSFLPLTPRVDRFMQWIQLWWLWREEMLTGFLLFCLSYCDTATEVKVWFSYHGVWYVWENRCCRVYNCFITTVYQYHIVMVVTISNSIGYLFTWERNVSLFCSRSLQRIKPYICEAVLKRIRQLKGTYLPAGRCVTLLCRLDDGGWGEVIVLKQYKVMSTPNYFL